jgi:hypothetical protein
MNESKLATLEQMREFLAGTLSFLWLRRDTKTREIPGSSQSLSTRTISPTASAFSALN